MIRQTDGDRLKGHPDPVKACEATFAPQYVLVYGEAFSRDSTEHKVDTSAAAFQLLVFKLERIAVACVTDVLVPV